MGGGASEDVDRGWSHPHAGMIEVRPVRPDDQAAWDAVGSEFGSRHTQYEMFYAGAQFVTRAHSFRTFDWNGATGLVDKLMSTYDLGGELDAGH